MNTTVRVYCPDTYTVSLGLRNAWVIFIRFRPTLCIGAEKRAVFLVSNRDQRGLSTLESTLTLSRISNIDTFHEFTKISLFQVHMLESV